MTIDKENKMKSESPRETWELVELALCDVRAILSGRKTLDEEQEILRLVRDNLQVMLERTRKVVAREAVLQTAINDLCKLQELQEEAEESGHSGFYPDWGDAWEQAFAVRHGAAQAANDLLEQLEEVVAREAVLQGVVANLCEQRERQEDMEECGSRGSYPSKFPEWEQAWEQAFAVRYGTSQDGEEINVK